MELKFQFCSSLDPVLPKLEFHDFVFFLILALGGHILWSPPVIFLTNPQLSWSESSLDVWPCWYDSCLAQATTMEGGDPPVLAPNVDSGLHIESSPEDRRRKTSKQPPKRKRDDKKAKKVKKKTHDEDDDEGGYDDDDDDDIQANEKKLKDQIDDLEGRKEEESDKGASEQAPEQDKGPDHEGEVEKGDDDDDDKGDQPKGRAKAAGRGKAKAAKAKPKQKPPTRDQSKTKKFNELWSQLPGDLRNHFMNCSRSDRTEFIHAGIAREGGRLSLDTSALFRLINKREEKQGGKQLMSGYILEEHIIVIFPHKHHPRNPCCYLICYIWAHTTPLLTRHHALFPTCGHTIT